MGLTLHMTFDGLVGLVLRPGGGGHGPEAFFALPDVRCGDFIADQRIAPHPARVGFETIDGETRTWYLDQEELQILSADGTPLNGGVAEDPSLASVARLADASDGEARFDESLIADPRRSGVLAGSFRAPSGRLLAGQISKEEHEFRESADSPGLGRGRFAESIELRIPIKDDSFQLISKGYFGDVERKAVLGKKKGGDQVLIRVRNHCEATPEDREATSDPDFLVYYRLAPNYSGPYRYPFRVTSSGSGNRAIPTKGCIPVIG